MQPVLLDSSVYIAALRRGKQDSMTSILRLGQDAPLWLSAVVLEELYSGAHGKALRAVERAFYHQVSYGRDGSSSHGRPGHDRLYIHHTGGTPVPQVYLFYVAESEGAIAGEIVKC